VNNQSDISQEQFERIDRYLTNAMSKAERSDFESSLKDNDLLNKQVEEIRMLHEAVEEQNLRNKLNEFHQEIDTENQKVISIDTFKKKSTNYKLYAVAASVAILIGLGYWLISTQKPQNEKLFAEYFVSDPGLITPMSATSNYEFYRGMVDYKQGEYDLAIVRWNQLIAQDPENDTLNFYLGVSYLTLENHSKATSYLEKVTGAKSSIFIPDVYYYLGLAALKQGNIEDAKAALKINGSEKALELISKLND